MNDAHHFITLSPELARALVAEIQAVLNGEASYFHAELWTEAGQQVGLHLSGPDDALDAGGPGHE
jgi:uncharacterized membrane protein